MYKLTDAADLEKAGHSIGNFFAKQVEALTKTHALHAQLAAHHGAASAQHTTHAANYKAHHDGLADGDVHKAMFAHGHTHHTAMAAHHDAIAKAHSAHAEATKAEIDAFKALSSDWGGTAKAEGSSPAVGIVALAKGEGIDAKINALTEMLMTKAFEALNNNPAIGEKIQQIVLEQVEKAVGGKLVPDGVHRVAPTIPAAGLTAVPRIGSAPIAKAAVPLEFEAAFSTEEEE